MKKRYGQNGFAVLEIILLVVIVGLIAGAGWYVYNSQHKTKNDLNNISSSETTLQKTTKSASTSNPATSQTTTQKYLVISQWGVKVPLTSDIADLTYTIDSAGSGVSFNSAKFVTLTNGQCNLANVDYLGRMLKTTDPNAPYLGGTYASFFSLKQIGSNYYAYVLPIQMYCQQTPSNQTQIDYFNSAKTSINNAVKSIIAN